MFDCIFTWTFLFSQLVQWLLLNLNVDWHWILHRWCDSYPDKPHFAYYNSLLFVLLESMPWFMVDLHPYTNSHVSNLLDCLLFSIPQHTAWHWHSFSLTEGSISGITCQPLPLTVPSLTLIIYLTSSMLSEQRCVWYSSIHYPSYLIYHSFRSV